MLPKLCLVDIFEQLKKHLGAFTQEFMLKQWQACNEGCDLFLPGAGGLFFSLSEVEHTPVHHDFSCTGDLFILCKHRWWPVVTI